MEPEIARRCKSCGAAVRAGSSFCPQCGVTLAKSDGSGVTAPASTPAASPIATDKAEQRAAEVAPAAEKVAPATDKTVAPQLQPNADLKATAPTMDSEALVNADTILPGTMDVPGKDATATEAPVENREQVAAQSRPADGPTDRQQRLTVGGRDAAAFDGAGNRAEKLRRASNVMLDEAAADPSLRFVLVAAVLIILSLLLLLLGRFL